MYLSIIFLPLIGAIGAGFFGRYLGRVGSMSFTTFFTFLSFVLSCFAFNEVALNGTNQYIYMAKWIQSGLFEANWSFLFDSLTVVMLIVVTGISTLVHFYSTEYMKDDPGVTRFMSYLSLFTFFMLMLVTGDNLMILFVGWEGVGLCSFLLINFWYTRIQANKAAMKAMVVNRIADVGLALGVFTLFAFLKAVDYEMIFSIIRQYYGMTFFCFYKEVPVIDAICFFLFIGAMGKSAQIGLHTWLPDAMEGPTPVSALIHAATMVTAGVFLLVRCSPLFVYSPKILDMITIVGATTAFFAATVGLVQNDLKRIIAYSTCSQLGYMIFACGVGNFGAAVFHLSNHAFFKALLFLSAGSVIHSMADEQDIRRMGGLRSLLPYTYSMFLIGNLALTGFPYLSGFYSKDLILESAYARYTFSGHYAYWLGTFAAFLTSFYSTRLMYLTFLGEPNGHRRVVEEVHEAPFRMALPLGILAICSIFIGYLTKDMFVGLGTDFWGTAIYMNQRGSVLMDAEFIPQKQKDLVIMLSIYGSIIAFFMYEMFFYDAYLYKLNAPSIGRLYIFFNRKWFFDKIINDYFTQAFLRASYESTYKALDKGFFEVFGPTGVIKFINFQSQQHISLYTGLIFHSSFMMLLGVTFFIGYYLISYYFGFAVEGIVVVLALIFMTLLYAMDFIIYEDQEELFDENIHMYEGLYEYIPPFEKPRPYVPYVKPTITYDQSIIDAESSFSRWRREKSLKAHYDMSRYNRFFL